jgi:hypothetical protein
MISSALPNGPEMRKMSVFDNTQQRRDEYEIDSILIHINRKFVLRFAAFLQEFSRERKKSFHSQGGKEYTLKKFQRIMGRLPATPLLNGVR